MAEYKKSTFSGDRWQRCREVHILDPYNKPPYITFTEEEVLAVAGEEVLRRTVGVCTLELSADLGPIPLISPTTGDALGTTMTRQQLYVALYSLYRMAAAARDAG